VLIELMTERPGSTEGSRPAARTVERRFAPDDGELVARVLRGDRWGEEALFRRHAPKLLDTLTRVLGRVDQADDAVQDAFVIAFRDLAQLRDPQRFGPWLRRIGIHRARRLQRRNALWRRFFRSDEHLTLDEMAAPGAPADVRAQLAAVDRVLAREKSAARTAWLLVRVEGATLEEAVSCTDTSLATVKRALARIDGKLSRLPAGGSRGPGEGRTGGGR
jgi:RNA polymerase sigma-70 factor (ECF subfamily)